MKKALAIINPISGTGKKANVPSLLEEAFSRAGIQLYISYTRRAGHAYELALEAAQQGYDRVVAIGGDGTVHEVASALLHTNTSLAIIPKGSGNGLARAIGIPMNTYQAAEIAAEGEAVRIDCCMANGRPFFCTCGVGFDAEVSAAFAEAPFRGLLSYAQTAISKYISYKPNFYELEIEGKHLRTEAFVVAAANANQYGNNAYIAPQAKMTDGKLDLVVLKPFSITSLAQITLQLFTKTLEDSVHQSSYQVDRASIVRSAPGVAHLDGEPVELEARIDLEVIPLAISVISPNPETL